MKWVTRSLVHFDRVASAWLIRRFVDPEAEFLFVEDGEEFDRDATPFAMPGVWLAAHDGEATTFQRIMIAYTAPDPALDRLAHLIASVVGHVMNDQDRTALATRDPLAGGILTLAEGVMLLSTTDAMCLKQSFPLYDALYARLVAQFEIDRRLPSPPASVLEHTLQIAHGVDRLRRSGLVFSRDSFAGAMCAHAEAATASAWKNQNSRQTQGENNS